MEFKQYRRKGYSEMRPVTEEDTLYNLNLMEVSVSMEDIKNGSPRIGDMIARNPKNHSDQWLVAKKYFEDNLELVD